MLNYEASRRFFDILISFLVIVFLSPLFLCAALSVKLDSEGPALFRQLRVGKDGRLFYVLKFRTMYQIKGSILTLPHDERITRIGKFLRLAKIDELPQFINVLMGDMSIVGPRPEIPEVVAFYTDEQKGLLAVKPGITSPASIKYRNEERNLSADNRHILKDYINRILPDKLAHELEYLKRRNRRSDIGIIFKTIGKLLSK